MDEEELYDELLKEALGSEYKNTLKTEAEIIDGKPVTTKAVKFQEEQTPDIALLKYIIEQKRYNQIGGKHEWC